MRNTARSSSTRVSTRFAASGNMILEPNSVLLATELPAETQHLIERLLAVNREQPVIDRPGIEAAVASHLRALKLDQLKVRWAHDAETGHLTARNCTENEVWLAAADSTKRRLAHRRTQGGMKCSLCPESSARRCCWASRMVRSPRCQNPPAPGDNVREGFFTRAEFEVVVDRLPDDLKNPARWAIRPTGRSGRSARSSAPPPRAERTARGVPNTGGLLPGQRPAPGAFGKAWTTACLQAGAPLRVAPLAGSTTTLTLGGWRRPPRRPRHGGHRRQDLVDLPAVLDRR